MKWRHFLTKLKISYITDKVGEIHRKNVKIENYGICTDKMVGIQIHLECNRKIKWRHFFIKIGDFPLTYV